MNDNLVIFHLYNFVRENRTLFRIIIEARWTLDTESVRGMKEI